MQEIEVHQLKIFSKAVIQVSVWFYTHTEAQVFTY